MARKKNAIPFYSLDGDTGIGIEIKRIKDLAAEEARYVNTAHRDDHYIFIFQESGSGTMMVDFKEVSVKGRGIYCILPGQVHYGVVMDAAMVWFLAVDVGLVSEQYRPLLEDRHQLVDINDATAEQLHNCLSLLQCLHDNPSGRRFEHGVMRSLVDAYLGMFTGILSAGATAADASHTRTAIITRQFKTLLASSFQTIKSPAAYAAALNISPSYLNEAVKLRTSMPVSYWIQEEIMTEARRLLFYTDNTVKQVADDLGFEDHAYFSRFFSKIAGITPLAYRRKYRE